MPLEHAGFDNESTQHAAERAGAHAQTQAQLSTLGQQVEAEDQPETPIGRTGRLGDFVEAHFADICPPEYRDAATSECLVFEDELRIVLDDESAQLEPADAEDEVLRGTLIKIIPNIAQAEAAVANETGQLQRTEQATTELTEALESKPDAPINLATVEQEVSARVKTAKTAAAAKTETRNQRSAELQTLKQVQVHFIELKAENGGDTVAALRSLLASDQLQSPQIREYLQNAIDTVEALTKALPGKESIITRLLNAATLDLSAGGGAATFADFMTAVDTSDALTAIEKTKLREVLHGPAKVTTGSDIKSAFAQGRGVITKPDGTTETIAYDEAHPIEWANGISVYPDGNLIRGSARIAGRSFPFKASSQISGPALTEQLNCVAVNAIKENAGVTGGSQQGFEATQGTKELDLSGELFETQAVRFGKLTFENMIDGFDASSRLITDTQVRQMQWGFQWLMPQRDAIGDGGYGDNNEAARMAALGGGGHDGLIWDSSDNLNEDNYRAACQFIRDQSRTGASEPDFQALVAHLQERNRQGEVA